MAKRIYAIRHAQKLQVPSDSPQELLADQPLSQEGVLQALAMGREFKDSLGLVHGFLAGMAQRTAQTAVLMAKVIEPSELVELLPGLYHMGSDNNGKDTFYPGFEEFGLTYWQEVAVATFDYIVQTRPTRHQPKDPVLIVVSTSVIIGAMIAHLRGIHTELGIHDAVEDFYHAQQYQVFDYTSTGIVLARE